MAISQRQYEAIVGLANRHSKTGPHDVASDHQLLVRAARLARRGRYHDAEALLATLPADGPLGPATLDLKAKILAQQGRYLEAEACWHQALKLTPDNQAFHRALVAIAEERRYPFWLRTMVAAAVAAVTSIAGVAVLIAVLKWKGWIGG